MNWLLLIILLFLLLIFFTLAYLIFSIRSRSPKEEATKALVNQIFGELSQKLLLQTQQALSKDRQAIYQDNLHQKEVVANLIKELRQELKARQQELHNLEKDRAKQFADLARAIAEHRQITSELKTSTAELASVLSNNQQRGQWGERIIEDILTSAGLIEHIHFEKQKPLGSTNIKPDITLLLPDHKYVAVDVKFPYSEIQKLASASTQTQKQAHLKRFKQDVKTKLNQLTKYILPEEGTVDYAIMFVPNEMLFSFINQQLPEIIDEAMAKKVMITSPFTFLIVARTVVEAYRNFQVETNLRNIIQYIDDFIEEWRRFTKEFDKFDQSLTKLRDTFDRLTTTRYKQMNLRIKRIEQYRQGDILPSKTTKAISHEAV